MPAVGRRRRLCAPRRRLFRRALVQQPRLLRVARIIVTPLGERLGSSRTRTGTTTRQSLSGTRGSTARTNTRGATQANYQRARANGTTFQTRQQAQQAFVGRNASQYPSRYASRPGSRPAHIPQNTRVDGRNVNVTYNAGLGGYGYVHPSLGTWVLYSAMADAAMLGVLMSNNRYYYGQPPGAY